MVSNSFSLSTNKLSYKSIQPSFLETESAYAFKLNWSKILWSIENFLIDVNCNLNRKVDGQNIWWHLFTDISWFEWQKKKVKEWGMRGPKVSCNLKIIATCKMSLTAFYSTLYTTGWVSSSHTGCDSVTVTPYYNSAVAKGWQ